MADTFKLILTVRGDAVPNPDCGSQIVDLGTLIWYLYVILNRKLLSWEIHLCGCRIFIEKFTLEGTLGGL